MPAPNPADRLEPDRPAALAAGLSAPGGSRDGRSGRGIILALLCIAGGNGVPAGAAEDGGRGFEDVTAAIGLAYRVMPDSGKPSEGVEAQDEAAGLALSDVDGDGRLDLYVTHGAGRKGRLFGWDGAGFVRRPGNRGIEPAHMDWAGYFIDLDADGWKDFVSLQRTGVRLFRNDGAGRFNPAPGISGLRRDEPAHSMAAADHDGDGDLDLFFSHWSGDETRSPAAAGYLWRNDGRGRYRDVSRILRPRAHRTRGARTPLHFSFTPTFADVDADGDPDLLLAGDFGTSQVLRNDRGLAFVETGKAVLTDENGMGAAAADYDRDGDIDWFVTSIFAPFESTEYGTTGNRLYRNIDGTGAFEDATGTAGVREGGWGWGACWADFDNDGHPDLFQTNGWHPRADPGAPDVPESVIEFLEDRSRLFMSNGDGTFTERGVELGIDHTGQGRGVVCADYDGDGGVDVFIANLGAAPTVYRNVFETGHHWLAVDLAGRHANPEAIGARVVVHTASGSQVQEVRFGDGYLSQGPPTLHFGLGREGTASAVEVTWPGPGGQVSRLENVPADRRLAIRQPAPDGFVLSVADGTGGGLHAAGARVSIEAVAAGRHYRFSHWSSEGGGVFADARSPATTFVMPARAAAVSAHFLPGPALDRPGVSVARRWIEVLLQAIRDDFARPTVHARNLFHLSAAMYDAWAAWSRTASPWLFGDGAAACPLPAPAPGGDHRRAREEAISHAAWRLVRHRFRHSPGAVETMRNADTLMSVLGHGAGGRPAAALGACIADLYIARGLADGANEADDYASLFYRPFNSDLSPADPGNANLLEPDRWQPLFVPGSADQAGFPVPDTPEFVTPEWGRVTPFALSGAHVAVRRRDGADWRVWHDPGPPPKLRGPRPDLYKWGFALVARWSGALSPDDGVLIDVAPSGIGNLRALPRSLGEHPGFYETTGVHGPGHRLNPATGHPYEPQVVPRGDYTRVLAEFWADGPDSETPPGHWFVIANAVGDHEKLVRRLGGQGPLLDRLEWDVKTYFTLGGAMHDAAIAAWGLKGWYDYVRPISAIRYMADQGQSSDPALPSWSPEGLPLEEGAIELVGPDDPLAGEDGAHVGKVKVRAWRGPDHVADPATDAAGVGWILAESWWPYQRPTFVTPPFAGYVSGHSTFSRAAAEVLTALTGDPFFPGGMSGFEIPANDFLFFERGPSVDMVLQWATYRDAADQCSLSRIWGGIHPPADDIPGRLIGARIGEDAFVRAKSLFRRGCPRTGETCDEAPALR